MRIQHFFVHGLVIVFSTVIVGVMSWYVVSQQQPEYHASVGLLVVQQQGSSFDPSAANRSAERIATTLSQVVVTDDFLTRVLAADFPVSDTFPRDLESRLSLWRETVESTVDGSFIRLGFYHPDRQQASSFAAASAFVLITQSQEWHGGGDSVTIKTVDPPIASQEPVRPNVFLTTFIGCMVGLIIGSAFIVYRFLLARSKQVKNSQMYGRDYRSFSGIGDDFQQLTVHTRSVYINNKNIETPSFAASNAPAGISDTHSIGDTPAPRFPEHRYASASDTPDIETVHQRVKNSELSGKHFYQDSIIEINDS